MKIDKEYDEDDNDPDLMFKYHKNNNSMINIQITE